MLRLCAWSIHFWRRAPASTIHLVVDFERGRVELAHLGRHAVDLGERAVEVLEVGDHHLVPLGRLLLEIRDQMLVDDGELARQVRLDVDVLVLGLDRRGRRR